MITIEFRTDTNSFDGSDHHMFLEAAHVLHNVAEEAMREAQIQRDDDCTLTKLIHPIEDSNGNTIGTLTYTKDLFPEYTNK